MPLNYDPTSAYVASHQRGAFAATVSEDAELTPFGLGTPDGVISGRSYL